jgi:transcriptional regulator with XRE-family HTH domain
MEYKSMPNIDNDLTLFYKTIGANVKKKREEKGLTQLALSEVMNLKSSGLISQSELYIKKQHFNLKHLYLISSILECDIRDFFEDVKMLPKNWEFETNQNG